MASCSRAGTTLACGSRAASAPSMRSRQTSSCAPNASMLAESSCTRMRRSAASFTRLGRRRTPASRALPAHALDLAQGNFRHRPVAQTGGVLDGQVRRDGARDSRPAHPDCQCLERVAERVVDRRALEAAMRHAVVAARVLAHAVFFPLGVLDQRSVGRRVSLVREQITGPLPTEHVIGWIAPRRALIGLVAGEKIQEQRGMIERPGDAGRAAAQIENIPEQQLAGIARQEHVLFRRMMIAVPGRHRDSLDAELRCRVEEFRHVLRVLAVEQGAIDGYAKALGLGQFNGRNRLVVNPFLTDRLVVALPIAVQMNRERKVRGGLVLIDVLGEQNRVRAEIDELLARDDAGDDLRHFLVDERFTARNGYDGRAALVDRAHRILDADPLLKDFLRVIDLAAAGAGEIALEQRFQHEHEWIALVAAQLAPRDIAGDLVHLQEWNGHELSYRARAPSPNSDCNPSTWAR